MKVKILPYLAFFLASLVFAYFSTGSTKEKQSSAQEWMALPKGSIVQMSYEGDGKKTEITREGEGENEVYWVEAISKAKTPEGEQEVKERFLANDKLKETTDALYSFQVEKIIGAAKDLKLEEFGLDKPTGHFLIKFSGDKTFKLALGKRGFQSPDVFALDEDKQIVLLVAKQIFASFERPKARLALTNPYRLNPDEVESAVLSVGDKHREYVRQVKGQSKSWYVRDKLDTPDEAFRNWLDKFLKIKVEAYPDEAQKTVIATLTPKFSILLKSQKAELDLLSVYEDVGSTPAKFWLKSKSLPVPVQVEGSKLSTLIADLASLAL